MLQHRNEFPAPNMRDHSPGTFAHLLKHVAAKEDSERTLRGIEPQMAIFLSSTDLETRTLAEELRALLGRVEVVETHISWVFLTDRLAYKLKKPVKFDFLDFSTADLRLKACQAEVELNRRLAPAVYLDVLPLSRDPSGRLEFSASKSPIDWVVKMRRLPAEKSLAALLPNDGLIPRTADIIADYLAHFYSSLPPALVKAEEYCQALRGHASSNSMALSEAFPESHRSTGAQLRYLFLQPEQFATRVVSGRIVDGHGDLRPEHIFAEEPPAVIDCIEFSEELRLVDIADELAFLDMECERIGNNNFGKRVLAKYRHLSGDVIPPAVESFYRGYRACVRAKVALLRSTQQTSNHSSSSDAHLIAEYLDLANHYAGALGPPSLVIIGGLPGTGKSTLAKEIASMLNCAVLSTDRLRQDSLGPSPAPSEYGQGRYEAAARQKIYGELFQQAAQTLSKGLSVVLDGTFDRYMLRHRAFELAAECHAVAVLIHCTCPREVALERMVQRASIESSASEARPEFFDRQALEFDPPDKGAHSISVETTSPLPVQMQVVQRALKHRLFE